jgi:hypothetical protein
MEAVGRLEGGRARKEVLTINVTEEVNQARQAFQLIAGETPGVGMLQYTQHRRNQCLLFFVELLNDL